MATKSIEVSNAAYSTMILHCSKYPSLEVLGFLLGSTSSSKVVIEKSIAVQHHWNRLSPMVEVAASLVGTKWYSTTFSGAELSLSRQAEAYAASQSPPLQLIGIYHAPSEITSSSRSELSPAAVKVAQSFAKKLNGEAVGLQVSLCRQVFQKDHSDTEPPNVRSTIPN